MNTARLFSFYIIILLFCLNIASNTKADPLYDQCMEEKPYGTNPEWGACGAENWKRLDNQLNSVWKIVLASYDGHPKADEIRKSLVAEQRAWLNYREDICAAYESGYWGREGQVLSAPNCNNDLLAARIDELRNHYCFEEKCGFDQPLEPYFIDLKNEKLVLSYFEAEYLQQMSANQSDSEADVGDTQKEYGINFVKDAIRDQKRFDLFLNKACLFTQYLDQNTNNNFQYQSCQSAIIDHRVQQLTSGEVSDTIRKLSEFANLGRITQMGDWLFGCDQSFSCTAIGYPKIADIFDKGQYIAIHWQFNSTKPALIRFIVASNDDRITGGEFRYHFSNTNLKFELNADHTLQPVIFASHIDEKDSGNFLKALLSEKQLSFGVDLKELPRSNISLKEFANFYNAQKENADALFANKVAPLPNISALPFVIDTPITLSDEDRTNCQSDIPLALNLKVSNGDHFVATCDDSGDRFTDNYLFQKQSPQGAIDARFDGKAHLSQEAWINNLTENNSGRELHSTVRYSGKNDCGRDYSFAYNGKVWQLSSFRAMPFCALIQQADWPQLFNSNLVKQ